MNGIIVLIVYTILMVGATMTFTKKTDGVDESFHVGNRKMGFLISAMSVAATWIWAPALFVSSERAYLNGLPGLFWFLVPNVLCLIFFIPFAKRIRAQMPRGITLSAYMGEHYQSPKVKGIYQFQLSSLAVFSTAVQLLAGSKMLSIITGIPFWILTVILAAIAYSYSQFSGIKASVLTDALQMVLMLVTSICFAFFAITRSTGMVDLINGFTSASGQYKGLFDEKGIELFFAFGLPTTVGLMSGPFGDQSFWQRAFSIEPKKIGVSFGMGAVFFAVVPLCMASLGFIAAGSGFLPTDTGVVNLEYIMSIFPIWTIIPFLFMVLSGLLSTVSSNLCAAASLTTDTQGRKMSKPVMIGLLGIAIAIANIPGLTVTHLFLFYGTLRASTLLPTVLTLLGKKLTANGVYKGVLASLAVGLPIFAYGNIMGIALYKTIGSLTTVLLSGVAALTIKRLEVWRYDRQKAEH